MAIDNKNEQLKMMMGMMSMKMGMMPKMMMPQKMMMMKKKQKTKKMSPPKSNGSLRGNTAQWLKNELNLGDS